MQTGASMAHRPVVPHIFDTAPFWQQTLSGRILYLTNTKLKTFELNERQKPDLKN